MSIYSFLKGYRKPKLNVATCQPLSSFRKEMPGKRRRQESENGEASSSGESASDYDSSDSCSESSEEEEVEEKPPTRDDHGPPANEETLRDVYERIGGSMRRTSLVS